MWSHTDALRLAAEAASRATALANQEALHWQAVAQAMAPLPPPPPPDAPGGPCAPAPAFAKRPVQGVAPFRAPLHGTIAEAIPIQARRVVTFHASHKLKEQIQDDPKNLATV